MSAAEPFAYSELRRTKLIAVIRAATPQAALAAAHAVVDGGITLVEVTYSVPDAPRVMRELSARSGIVVGAGTVLTDDWLVKNRNNYIVAIDPRGAAVGLAGLDITTGELTLEVVPAVDLEPALARYEAREVVLPLESTVTAPEATVTTREAWEFDPELAREDLTRTYSVASLDGFGIPHSVHIEVGERAKTITETARRLRCDHIVMSTARKNSLTRLVENSVTNKVIELTPVPVEVIAGDSMSKWERYGIPTAIGALLALIVAAVD